MFHVKQSDDLKKLQNFLATQNIILSDQHISKLEKYESELVRFAGKHRIVSSKDVDLLISRHFLSSFYFVNKIAPLVSPQDNILDLGSGAGFPGIILSIMLPNNIVLVDSVRKKALFLNRLKKKLDLNCEIINDRIEIFSKKEKRLFKIVTARALASINDLIDLAQSFIFYGELHTIKGIDFENENSGRESEIDLSYNTIEKSWVDYSGYLNNKAYITFSIKKGS